MTSSEVTKTNGFFQVKCCQVSTLSYVLLMLARVCKRLILVVVDRRFGLGGASKVVSTVPAGFGNSPCCLEENVFVWTAFWSFKPCHLECCLLAKCIAVYSMSEPEKFLVAQVLFVIHVQVKLIFFELEANCLEDNLVSRI